MCKRLIILGLAALMLSIGGTVFAQSMVTLDQAIGYSATEIESRLEPGARVMVLNFRSPSQRLSSYVLDEMTTALTRSGRLTTVDKTNLDFLLRELRYERSGDINDEAAQSVGRILGAQYVVSGVIEEAASNFVVQFKTLPVEPAAIQTLTRVGVIRDNQIANMLSLDASSQIRSVASRVADTYGQTDPGFDYGAADLNQMLVLSAGGGVFGKIEFDHYRENNRPRVDTATGFGVPLFLNAELYSYLLLELSPYYHNHLVWDERVNVIGAGFSLFGQYPIRLADRITVSPLLGIGYDMAFVAFFMEDNKMQSFSRGDDEFSNWLDFLYLRPGVRLNYNLTPNLRFETRFIWDFVLYNRILDGFDNTMHVPNLFLGLNYVFLRF